MDKADLIKLINHYKSDTESVYHTWFIGSSERMKAFRAIRRGVIDTVESIKTGKFGTDFKGSTLEVVLNAITEQKQVFKGAAHPFFWKPKLRIPDIYENEINKQHFGAFLEACLVATRDEQVLAEISRLSAFNIKGLGPAVASIIYFLHPTIIPPFNTAIVNGFNALFCDKKKLGSWDSYLIMREMIINLNGEVRELLSKDLGAFAGLLFEIGSGRLSLPGNMETVFKIEKEKAEISSRRRHAEVLAEQNQESEHTQIQYLLIKLGRALKYNVHVARNDRHRTCDDQLFSMHTISELPGYNWPPEVKDTVSLIDVLWLDQDTKEIVSAFEIEKSTSIYSGILRLEDLARTIPECKCNFYLLAPNDRKKEVLAQFSRPSIQHGLENISLFFIPFNDLRDHCDSICKLGEDHNILKKIAHTHQR